MKKEIYEGLNKYLADAGVMYIKLHNLHWNVVGPQFKAVHEYLEGLYDNYAEVIDEVAELIKIKGETPYASLKEYLAASTIEELASKEIPTAKGLEIAKKDLEQMRKAAFDLRKVADAEDEFDVVGMMEDHLGHYDKTLWFLNAMGK